MTSNVHELTTPAATVGARLRRLRKERHLTQTELARQIGIQQSDLSRMEQGEYRVSLDNLFKILAVFDVDINEFFEQRSSEPEERRPLSREDMQTLHLLRQLSDEGRREVMEYLEFKVRREQQDRRAVAARRADRETGS
ncbi:MAG TPA: helix-turn-helix transcriptional regulator [Candidatus Sulfomarinibacteraceae bacterium]|nr:helix-turn-helix transcriptional regulator [Candidatus Sulfomarinibacteraceae bacterium]